MVSGWIYPPITDQPGPMFLQMHNCDCFNGPDAVFLRTVFLDVLASLDLKLSVSDICNICFSDFQ